MFNTGKIFYYIGVYTVIKSAVNFGRKLERKLSKKESEKRDD